MNRVTMEESLAACRSLGRTFWNADHGVLYMNWTCSGVEFEYTGTSLEVEFTAMPGAEVDDPVHPELPTRATWPWIGMVLDDGEELSFICELGQPEQRVKVWESAMEETHRIRLVKLTENPKGMAGIRAFVFDGKMVSFEREKRMFVEFVGDSITCGFGNMNNDPARLFWSEDENGWYSHAAIAGRILGAETELISYSGICAVNRTWLPQPYGMSMLYPYQDRVLEDRLNPGREESHLTLHDFTKKHRDVVVLNLGTNDATGIMFQEDKPAAEAEFMEDYPKLVRQIREVNGPETHIVCALGSIDYMLFTDIEKIVEKYRRETGDENISVFRYYKMAPLEGVAPCGHPTKASQERMGREIAEYIRTLN